MKHQLILFYGSCPGAGKSTLSARLNGLLTEQDLPVRWIYEDDVLHLDLFTPVTDHFQGRSDLDAPQACLAATKKLVDQFAKDKITVIADSILPYYDWLLAADYPFDDVSSFSQELSVLLQPMRPLIIYLQADASASLSRAIEQRGPRWLEENIAFMNTWSANQTLPIRNLADAIAYSRRTDKLKVQLLSQWPGEVLWLDGTANSIESCFTVLLDYLRLSPPNRRESISTTALSRYVGNYIARDEEPPDGVQQVIVKLQGHDLWVNLYWPKGCRLVAGHDNTFQLENTTHHIEFIEHAVQNAKELHYHYRGKVYVYEGANLPKSS